ncbi:hypothetical protein BXY41_103460 [Lacrimispora xylanisolvens]|uniref:Uncharacterized protein n=1 Tax=Lacrimispora xylanisolvens TaxID=384636 RepID=A0A2S6HWB8_9FIRM|nr:hypothetical protein [Hungatella xylanolytica]PPK82244.1 hypothetical protein BXY41_103460 [Hungatella xylanolytica]
MPSKKPILTIRTTEELIERLRKLSEEQNRSISNTAETILKNYLDELEAKQEKTERKKSLEKSSNTRTG